MGQSRQVRRPQAEINDEAKILGRFSSPQLFARDSRAFASAASFAQTMLSATIGSVRTAVPKPQSTPAITPLAADDVGVAADALRHELRMLDEIGGRNRSRRE